MCLILFQSKVLSGWHNTEGVGVTHSTSPSLHTYHGIATLQNTELHGAGNTVLETTINILLPWNLVEIWLRLLEMEWVDATVQVGVLLDVISFRYDLV